VGYPIMKDESDLELALRFAVQNGADDVVLLGIFGGERLDHALANATLLGDPAYAGLGLRAVHGGTEVRALHAGSTIALRGDPGDVVTLLPVDGNATGVRTTGLRYPLDGETLLFGRSRGLSNIVASRPASVSLEHGVLLVIEIRKGGTT
jgi:thiamine pyrophosphokinase